MNPPSYKSTRVLQVIYVSLWMDFKTSKILKNIENNLTSIQYFDTTFINFTLP